MRPRDRDQILEGRLHAAMLLAMDRPDDARRALDDFLPEITFRVRADVDTARIVRCGERYRIEFGQAFLDRELQEPRNLAFVFLHEVYHHVLGHLASLPPAYRTPAWEQVANLAADMMVNRAVAQRYFPAGPPLLDRLYRPDRFPECLLLPPTAFGMPSMTAANPQTRAGRRSRRRMDREVSRGLCRAGLDQSMQREACRVYHAGWLEDVPFDRLVGLVGGLLRRVQGDCCFRLRFLGNHEPGAERLGDLPWPAAEDEDDGGAQGGNFDDMVDEEIDEDVEPSLSPTLAMAVRLALVDDPNHPRRRFGREAETGVLFAPGRSDWLALATGQWPALFHGPAFGSADDDQRAHVYIDVSGSVERWIGRLYGLVLGLGDEIGSPVHLFSNQVLDLTLQDLAKGRVCTTGGTDFDCVVKHAIEQGHRRIVVVSDGMGDLEPENAEAFLASGASLYLVLMGMGIGMAGEYSPLTALARNVWEME